MASEDEDGHPCKSAAAERCRALVAEAINLAAEDGCLTRDELLDLVLELDTQATATEALVAAQRPVETVERRATMKIVNSIGR